MVDDTKSTASSLSKYNIFFTRKQRRTSVPKPGKASLAEAVIEKQRFGQTRFNTTGLANS